MDGLRETIMREVKAGSGCSENWAYSKADAILALPELKEALESKARMTVAERWIDEKVEKYAAGARAHSPDSASTAHISVPSPRFD